MGGKSEVRIDVGEKRSRRRLGLFLRDRRGTTVIEFAALIFPFCLLLFGIIESCVSFAAGQILANSADDIARQVRTGQLRAAVMDTASVKATICGDMKIIVATGCLDNLVVDLREVKTFAEAALIKTKYTSDKDIDALGFDVKPGPALSKNVLRVFYKWPVMTDFMRSRMSNLKDDKTLQFSEVVWQNEPFTD